MSKSVIKVLYISNLKEFYGGASRSLYELLENIDRQKIVPYFASIHDGNVAKRIQQLNIPYYQLRRSRLSPPFLALSSIHEVLRIIINNQIDIIHNNQCDDALYSWLPAKLSNKPIIIHHRDPSFYKRNEFLRKYVDYNIAISTWQNEHNLKGNGIVIHNGIALNKFIEKAEKYKSNKKEKNLIIGLLGRIAPIKGQNILIKAAKKILKRYPRVRFVIAGDRDNSGYPSYVLELDKLIQEYDIADSVIFAGYVDGSEKILNSFDISVVPSYKEPFGRVIIESMALGKPVIATNLWGVLDIVTEETGLLVPPGDPDALADAVIQLIENEEKRKELGEAGFIRVKENFTIQNTLFKINNLYERIIAENY